MIIAGLDIGGTKCASIIAEVNGDKVDFLFRKEFPTKGSWREVLDKLIADIKSSDYNPEACGISCGGPLSGEKGMIYSPPNLPGWDDVPVTEYITKKTGIPAKLLNDADACAVSEWKFGAGRGTKNMIFLTFGTGLGAGLILNGALYSGGANLAGEAGHIRLASGGPYGYSKNGSFEGFCSGGGIAKQSSKYFGIEKTAKESAALAFAGDKAAIKLYNAVGKRLGQGLAILIDLLNPEAIVIGGIFMRSHALLEKSMYKVLEKECLPVSLAAVKILPAELGERIGDYGAVVAAVNG